jgi:acetolactate synthase-1/2/3 large subunit
MPRMTGGQALVESLKREGLDTIFALPGVQLDWAFDALYEARDSIKVIHTRHEQATAYMADGYARTTGKVGACLVVPGPGLLNAASAISTAYAVNSPVLCITGQIQSDLIDAARGLLHEIDDQVGMIRHITKWAARANTPNEVPIVVHEAFRQLRSGRPRPAAVEVPPDVLQMIGEVRLGEPLQPERLPGDPEKLARLAERLGKAERPVVLAGSGIHVGAAWEELRTLAEALEAPVVMSDAGRGALPDSHRLAFNQLALPDLLPGADAVLAVGTKMLDFARQPIRLAAGQWLGRIDAEAAQLSRNAVADLPILGDAKLALADLVDRVGARNRRRPERAAELAALKRAIREDMDAADPQARFGKALRDRLPDDGIVVSEMTQVGYWGDLGFPIERPRSYLTSGYQGTLGAGFPTALGAQVANPDRRVVSINGDGGFMFNVQELATAAQHDIPLITVVFDDGAFGNVQRIQERLFGGRTIASDLTNPSFARVAEVFGVQGIRAEGPDGLDAALKEAVDSTSPTLIHVPVGPMPPFRLLIRERMAQRMAVR